MNSCFRKTMLVSLRSILKDVSWKRPVRILADNCYHNTSLALLFSVIRAWIQMGPIFLGMPGPWAVDNYESSDHYTTKIGGLPDWPISKTDIRPELLECGACGGHLCLVAQVYAPIAGDSLKIEERIIYVLGCLMPKCGSNPNSWRTLRVQKSYNEAELNSTNQDISSLAESSKSVSNSNWWEMDLTVHGSGEEDDNGSDEDEDLYELGRALSDAASLLSHSKKQNSQSHPEAVVKASPRKPSTIFKETSIPVVPCFYVYSQEESSSSDIGDVCAKYSLLSIKSHLEDPGSEEKWEQEGYEYDRALSVDRTYLKFKKRMDANPKQCFRYSHGGKPLVATTEIGKPRTCDLCGAPRHYEMQLMPPLLYFLHEATDSLSKLSLEEWNWMTLIIYTCSKSCSHSLDEAKGTEWIFAEEVTVVQYDD